MTIQMVEEPQGEHQSIAVLSSRAQAVAIIDEATKNQVITWATQAGAYVSSIEKVEDQGTYDKMVMAGVVLATCKKKLLDEWFDPWVQKAHEEHGDRCKKRKEIVGPIAEDELAAGRKQKAFADEQKRLQREESERLRLIAQKEADDFALAQAEELRKQMEAENAAPEEIEAVVEEVLAEATQRPLPAPIAPPTYRPSADTRKPTILWSARITSLQLLCRAVGEGKAPTNYVIGIKDENGVLSSPALNNVAKGAKNTNIGVPGVVGISKESNASFKTTR